MLVFAEMQRAIEAAAHDKLPDVASALWKAFGAGGLSEAEAEQLGGLLEARQSAAQAAPPRGRTLGAEVVRLVPRSATPPAEGEAKAQAPANEGQHAPAIARAHACTGSRPRTPESMSRRRRWAAAGYLPPALAQAFTAGEQAVLAVVALEVGKRGACSLALGHVAALAGVSATTAKRALRQAKLLGLVSIEERRLSRWRSDTNVVRVVSREWATWLRLRLPRGNHAGLMPPGGQSLSPTKTGSFKGAASRPLRGELRRPAGASSTFATGQRRAGA